MCFIFTSKKKNVPEVRNFFFLHFAADTQHTVLVLDNFIQICIRMKYSSGVSMVSPSLPPFPLATYQARKWNDLSSIIFNQKDQEFIFFQ